MGVGMGDNAWIPPARVKAVVQFSQITGFIPSDADIDLHFGAYISATGQYNQYYENLDYHPTAECFHKKVVWENRNNYIIGAGANVGNLSKYTFVPIARGIQTKGVLTGSTAFVSTADLADPYYPTQYEGPRWSMIKMPSSSNTSYVQFMHQSKTGAGSAWALQQTIPMDENQPFWIEVKKSQSLNPDENNTVPRSAYDPVDGSFFMVVVGGFVGAPDSDQNNNSYSFVFPINDTPFIIDNPTWAKNIANIKYTGDYKKDNALMQEAVEKSIITRKVGSAWVLGDDVEQFRIVFMYICNRIYISSTFSGGKDDWIFPDKSTVDISTDSQSQTMHITEKYSAKYKKDTQAMSTGFALPKSRVEIHGKGFTASVNFNPMEFDSRDGYFLTPILQFSKDQTLVPWALASQDGAYDSNYDDKLIFALPDSAMGTGTGNSGNCWGFDLDGTLGNGKTGMGLDSTCVEVQRSIDDKLASEIKNYELGPGTSVNANSGISQLTYVRQYKIIIKGDKYRTPFVYRIKMKSPTTFVRPDPFAVDISYNIQNLEHSIRQQDYAIIQKNVKLTCYMPKQNDPFFTRSESGEGTHIDPTQKVIVDRSFTYGDGESGTIGPDLSVGSESIYTWGRLSRNPCLIRIWIGAQGPVGQGFDDIMYPKDDVTGENCFFTGISFGGDSTFSSAKDTVTLDCWDYISLLEELMYINSPFFDGMSLHYAIAYILERSGVSVLSAIDNNPHLYIEEGFEETIKNYVLPTSNRFLSPLKKFKEGTKLIEALKDFINIFWVTFKCDNKGSYVLGTWEGLAGASPKDTRFAQTNDIGGTIVTKNKEFVTFVPEGDSSYKYNVLYDKKVISPKVKQWFNVFCVKTVERYTNIPEIVTDGFRDSITGIGGNAANGIPDNFIGYMKLYFTQESSLGGAQSAREMIHTVKNVIGQTRTWCTIRIVGRRGLELLDIIKIDNNYYRIMELRGSVSSTPNPVWWMDVVAENIGYFNNDVDTSDINMYPNQ